MRAPSVVPYAEGHAWTLHWTDQVMAAPSHELLQWGPCSQMKALNQVSAANGGCNSSEWMVHIQGMEHSGVEMGLAEKHISILWSSARALQMSCIYSIQKEDRQCLAQCRDILKSRECLCLHREAARPAASSQTWGSGTWYVTYCWQ